jgi:TolB-like protein
VWRKAAISVLALTLLAGTLPAGQEAKADGKAGQAVVIAALPFSDSSPGGKYAPLADAMGDMLVSFMSKAEGITFVERADLNKVLQEQRLSLSGLTDEKTRANVGRLVGAKYILTGGVTVLDGVLRVNAHLFEVETTRVARSEEAEGKVEDLVKPVDELARKLGKDLDLKLPELKPSDIDRSPEANLHFMRGLGYYYGKMPDHAIAEFMKALALKPDHAQARYWNGVCYFDDKEYEHARIEFDRFLKEFPNHELAPEVKEMLARCSAETEKSKPAEKGK